MKIRLRISVNGKRLRYAAGLILIALPVYIVLLKFGFSTAKIKQLVTRPYWERALAERAKRVPKVPEMAQTAEEIGSGTLGELPLYHLFIKVNTLAEFDEILPRKKEYEPGPGWLPDSARIYKPADFEYRGKTWPVRIRLRGDSPVHWMAQKQSWRIKFPKEDPFEGARRIDLINPKHANAVTEYIAMWTAEKMGILAPRIKFINLKINHHLLGVYQQTEHIDKYFLENHGRPVGNVYGEKDKKPVWFGVYPLYTDVVFWRKHCENETQSPNDYTELEQLLRVLNDPSDEKFVARIFTLLDREKFYRWNCHMLIGDSKHQDWFHNARLYFDPTRGLFEFIPWDFVGFLTEGPFFFDSIRTVARHEQYNPIVKRVIRHGPFRLERDRVLWSFVKDDAFLDEILRESDRIKQSIQAAVYLDAKKEAVGPRGREAFNNEVFEGSFKEHKRTTRSTFHRLREALRFNDLKAAVIMGPGTVGMENTQDSILADIEIVNSASSAAAVTGLVIPLGKKASDETAASSRLALVEDTNGNGYRDPADSDIAELAWDGGKRSFSCSGFRTPIYPDLDEKLQPVSTRRNYFVVRTDGDRRLPLDASAATTAAVNAVTGEAIEVPVQMVDAARDGFDIPLPETSAEFKSLYPDIRCAIYANGRISLAKGEYRISKTVVVPATASLEIPAGTTLRFAPGCSLLSYGRVEAKGTADEPVRFTALEPREGWGVLALWRA